MGIVGAYALPHPPLIIPQIGNGEEKKIQRTVEAYDQAAREIASWEPETLVIISPHAVMYQDYIHIAPGERAFGSFERFGYAGVGIGVSCDLAMGEMVEKKAKEAGIAAGGLGRIDDSIDHGGLIPLYFIRRYLPDFQVCRISVSGLGLSEHYRFGMCLRAAAEALGRRIAIVASGDLSHHLKDSGVYSYTPQGPAFDKRLTDDFKKGDFMDFFRFSEDFCQSAGECGMRGFMMMAGAFEERKVKPRFLSYEGPFGVGYCVCGFLDQGPDPSRGFYRLWKKERRDAAREIAGRSDPYVQLARRSIQYYLKERHTMELPEDLPCEMREKQAGVFVSLKKEGRLRGCIGTIEPTCGRLGEEILYNAVGAAIGDPRFPPVQKEELEELVITVDVLSEPQPVSGPEDLDPRRYGVIVSYGNLKGLLLPDLEGIHTPQEQIRIALKKAGIPSAVEYKLSRFEVTRHH